MGRIVSPVSITNYAEPSKRIMCDALVDTGSAYMILPKVWKDRLGKLATSQTVPLEMANQGHVEGEICGPVRVEVEGFRPVWTEVIFLDMEPKDGRYEPLIGYIVLEAIPAAVDMLGHRLVAVKAIDLK